MSRIYRVIIICLVLFSVVSVFISIPPEDNFAKFADEGHYFNFASLISKNGVSEFPKVATAYIDKKEARLFPPPLRVGHILATALWFKIFPPSFVSLARFSFLCFVLFLMISFYFARKHFGADIAYIFTLLLSSSPLMMAMGRRALSDMHGNLFWGLTVWLFLDFLEKQDRLKYVIFILALYLSILVRESSAVLAVFIAVFFFIYKYNYKRSLSNFYLLGILVLPVILVGATYIILFDGISNAVSIVGVVLGTHADFSAQTSKYALLFCTGPWYRYIVDYLLLSPFTTLLFIGYFFHKLLSRKIEWGAAYFMTYFAIVFVILSNLKYSKVVRFVINLDMVIALFSAFSLYELLRQKNGERQARLVFLAAAAIFFINYGSFINIFCVNGVYDPVSYWLLFIRKFIP